jgi:prepilin-type N-terminal cleavage/methylation domain-containing protein
MKRRGFSLIELVILLVILGIISVVAFIRLDPYKGIKLDAGAKKVAADLQTVRNLSLSLAKWYGVSFEVDPVNTYTVYETTGTLDAVIENPAQPGKNFQVALGSYYDGIKILSVNISGGNKVEFHPAGAPYNDKNGAPIVAIGRIVLGFSGVTKEVNISPNTGEINIP